MGRRSKYPAEVRERAVRLVFEQQGARSMMLFGLLVVGAACASDRSPSPCPPPGAVATTIAPATALAAGPVVLDAAMRKRHRLELLIAQIDPVLHGVRLGYRPDDQFGWGWTWPSYFEPARVTELIVELERRARELPALGALDEAVSRYGRDTLALALQLRTIVVGTTPAEAEPGAHPREPVRADVVEPLFERMRASSHAVHAALRVATPLPASPPGTPFTLERRCLEAASLLVDVPGISAEAPAGSAVTLDRDLLRAHARACVTAAIDLLDAPGAEISVADFGLGVGTSMFREVARLRAAGTVSWGGNVAQSMQYLAERGVTALDAAP